MINENEGAFSPINEFEVINRGNSFVDNPLPNKDRKSIIEMSTNKVNTIFLVVVIF